MALQMTAPSHGIEPCELAGLPERALLRRSPHRAPEAPVAPHQNRRVAGVEEQAGRKPLRASFSGASSGRASIYACKAFNTDTRAGSIGDTFSEPSPTAAQPRRARAKGQRKLCAQ